MNKEIIKNKVQQLVNHYNAGNYKLVINESNLLLQQIPNNIFLYNLMGSSFQRLGDQETAKKIFLNILHIDKKNIHAMNNLGNTHKILNEFSLAEKYYTQILEINPNFTSALVNYGSLNYKLNKFDKATALFEKALKIEGDDSLIHYNMGLNYQSLGYLDKARFHFNELLRIDPKSTLADRLISRITNYNINDDHLKKMSEKLNSQDLTENSKIDLYFSLSKAFEDCGNFEKSYSHLELGNKLKNKISEFDTDKNTKLIQNLIKFFENYKFDRKLNNNDISKNKNVIFILGMPRSGTSLVEQIISSHPNVYGAGELDYLNNLIRKNIFSEHNSILTNVDDSTLSKISVQYNDLIKKFDSSEEVITDKALHNFLWIGFIKILFPEAKIVHCQRNRKDNCLSIYKNLFDENLNWAYDQSKILSFYKDYFKIMKFWKVKIPGFIFDLNYEDLISDAKINIENLLNFCNLDWHDDCLQFYKTERQVKTVSFAQVRKPIYNTSVNSSKNFEPFLIDFFSNLEKIN